jgi:hypothetical protein
VERLLRFPVPVRTRVVGAVLDRLGDAVARRVEVQRLEDVQEVGRTDGLGVLAADDDGLQRCNQGMTADVDH